MELIFISFGVYIYIYMYEKTWPHFITYCFVGSCFLQSVGICGLYLLMNVKVVEVCVQESICFVVVWVSCHFVVPEMWYRVCGFISVFCAFSALTNNMHCSTVTTANCLQNKKIKLCQWFAACRSGTCCQTKQAHKDLESRRVVFTLWRGWANASKRRWVQALLYPCHTCTKLMTSAQCLKFYAILCRKISCTI